MGFFGKAQCALGMHIGDFSFVRTGSCEQVKRCGREHCTHVERRVAHSFGPWALVNPSDTSNCDTRRVCARCGETESGDGHDWSIPQYVEKRSCEQLTRCQRCRQKKTVLADCRYQWRYINPDRDSSDFAKALSAIATQINPCAQEEACTRCGSLRTLNPRTKHQWGPWQPVRRQRESARTCRRCNERETRPITG